jgi:hypothetical protein
LPLIIILQTHTIHNLNYELDKKISL